ncbi:hypothetical protein PhCBS80983_g00278 [Powellomyces hirtus]|uniref:Lysophospholipase n=1 Tax=Powellomyces hirtus TaxID=109895 RepID=A0A507EH64_9FUNG|nr:hypothetical protein PhCBS80983_g00278 [Powellomyces hirtus]
MSCRSSIVCRILLRRGTAPAPTFLLSSRVSASTRRSNHTRPPSDHAPAPHVYRSGRSALMLSGLVGLAGSAFATSRPLNTEDMNSDKEIVSSKAKSEEAKEDRNKSTLDKIADAADQIKEVVNQFTPHPDLPDLSKHLTQVSDQLRNLSALHRLAQESARLTSKIPTSQDIKELTERVPQDISKHLESLTASIPSITDEVRELSDKLQFSKEEWTNSAIKIWTDAIQSSVDSLTKGTLIAQLQRDMDDIKQNPEIEWEAEVRIGADLCDEEYELLESRQSKAAKAISEFIGEKVDVRDLPIIGVAASGGGCRAMVSSLASFEALYQMGLLQGTSYIAGVSGSTWAMAQLFSLGPNFSLLRDRLAKQLSSNYLSMAELVAAVNSPSGSRVLGGIAQKYFGDRNFSTVDLFGTLLTARLLVPEVTRAIRAETKDEIENGKAAKREDDENEEWSHQNFGKLSNQRWAIERDDLPMPIYTAVSHDAGTDRPYQWWEFTPYEVGFCSCEGDDSAIGAWVETWGFGRRFKSGESIEKFPEQSFGILLGTFGSAFTATVAHIWNEVSEIIPKTVRDRVLPLLEDISQLHPLSPITFPNIVYKMDEFGEKSEVEDIALMDSGMDNNIPFAPLLRTERKVDVIIALNASMDIGIDPWLRRAEAYAKQQKVPFPQIPEKDEITTCTVFSTIATRDSRFKGTAADSDDETLERTVIYMPLIKNPSYNPTLDPCHAEWCATHNFTFTEAQTNHLCGLAWANMNDSTEQIRQAIRAAWKAKRRNRLLKAHEERGPGEDF